MSWKQYIFWNSVQTGGSKPCKVFRSHSLHLSTYTSKVPDGYWEKQSQAENEHLSQLKLPPASHPLENQNLWPGMQLSIIYKTFYHSLCCWKDTDPINLLISLRFAPDWVLRRDKLKDIMDPLRAIQMLANALAILPRKYCSKEKSIACALPKCLIVPQNVHPRKYCEYL